MATIVGQLRDWLVKERPFRMERLEKDAAQTSDVEASLSALPPEVSQNLTALIDELPSHPSDVEAIQETLSTAVARWKKNPAATNNSLTIVGSPVSAVARILAEGLADWSDDNDLSINLLDWIDRPAEPTEISSKLQKILGSDDAEAGSTMAIIPNLSWCFLRTAEGLNGIDYLRDSLLSDRRKFWVIGSGQVGFQYLNCILKLQAHCGEVLQLPRLSSEQLKVWLMPIIEAVNIRLDEDSIQERLQHFGAEHLKSSSFGTMTDLLDELNTSFKARLRNLKEAILPVQQDHDSSSNGGFQWKDYFERLADLSDGVSTVALQLFVASIYYEKVDEDTKDELQEAVDTTDETLEDYVDLDPPPMHRIIAKLPKLPTLPHLEQNDLYILYSLLVHGDLTIAALAQSLGEEQQNVNDSIQIMRGKGVIEQQADSIKVNPMHYPRLKRRLASNNFIIDSPS